MKTQMAGINLEHIHKGSWTDVSRNRSSDRGACQKP